MRNEKRKREYAKLIECSRGRATARELNDAIRLRRKLVKAVEIKYKKNVMAGMSWTNEWQNINMKVLFYGIKFVMVR